jgi:hypothetical protein
MHQFIQKKSNKKKFNTHAPVHEEHAPMKVLQISCAPAHTGYAPVQKNVDFLIIVLHWFKRCHASVQVF